MERIASKTQAGKLCIRAGQHDTTFLRAWGSRLRAPSYQNTVKPARKEDLRLSQFVPYKRAFSTGAPPSLSTRPFWNALEIYYKWFGTSQHIFYVYPMSRKIIIGQGRKDNRCGHEVGWCNIVTIFSLWKKCYFQHIFSCAWIAILDLAWKQRSNTNHTVGQFTSLRNAVTSRDGRKWYFIEIIIKNNKIFRSGKWSVMTAFE